MWSAKCKIRVRSAKCKVQRIPMLMLLKVTPTGLEVTAKLLVKGREEGGRGRGSVLRSFLRLPKQEGLQLAEASFCENAKQPCRYRIAERTCFVARAACSQQRHDKSTTLQTS